MPSPNLRVFFPLVLTSALSFSLFFSSFPKEKEELTAAASEGSTIMGITPRLCSVTVGLSARSASEGSARFARFPRVPASGLRQRFREMGHTDLWRRLALKRNEGQDESLAFSLYAEILKRKGEARPVDEWATRELKKTVSRRNGTGKTSVPLAIPSPPEEGFKLFNAQGTNALPSPPPLPLPPSPPLTVSDFCFPSQTTKK